MNAACPIRAFRAFTAADTLRGTTFLLPTGASEMPFAPLSRRLAATALLAFAAAGATAADPPSHGPAVPSIARVWHGRTSPAKADEYERYLKAEIRSFPSIKGNLGYQLMRLDGGPDGQQPYVEFEVVSYWCSLDAIKAFAGSDVRRTHNLPRDPEFLMELEPFVRNYTLEVDAVPR